MCLSPLIFHSSLPFPPQQVDFSDCFEKSDLIRRLREHINMANDEKVGFKVLSALVPHKTKTPSGYKNDPMFSPLLKD